MTAELEGRKSQSDNPREQQPETKPADSAAAPGAPRAAGVGQSGEPVRGTRVLPMPGQEPVVAGMPRNGRGFNDPGHPGIIRPEDDVYGNEPSDLSESR